MRSIMPIYDERAGLRDPARSKVRPRVRAEAIFAVIRFPRHLIQVIEALRDEDRAEYFFAHDAHVGVTSTRTMGLT